MGIVKQVAVASAALSVIVSVAFFAANYTCGFVIDKPKRNPTKRDKRSRNPHTKDVAREEDVHEQDLTTRSTPSGEAECSQPTPNRVAKQIPGEVLLYLFSLMDPKSAKNASNVCRAWKGAYMKHAVNIWVARCERLGLLPKESVVCTPIGEYEAELKKNVEYHRQSGGNPAVTQAMICEEYEHLYNTWKPHLVKRNGERSCVQPRSIVWIGFWVKEARSRSLVRSILFCSSTWYRFDDIIAALAHYEGAEVAETHFRRLIQEDRLCPAAYRARLDSCMRYLPS